MKPISPSKSPNYGTTGKRLSSQISWKPAWGGYVYRCFQLSFNYYLKLPEHPTFTHAFCLRFFPYFHNVFFSPPSGSRIHTVSEQSHKFFHQNEQDSVGSSLLLSSLEDARFGQYMKKQRRTLCTTVFVFCLNTGVHLRGIFSTSMGYCKS